MKKKKTIGERVNLFKVIPDEIICCEIMPWLPVSNLINVFLTSKEVNNIVDNELSWSSLLKLYYPKEVIDEYYQLFKRSEVCIEMKDVFQKLFICHQNSSKNYEKLYKLFVNTKEIESYFPNVDMDKLTSLSEKDFRGLVHKYQKLREKTVKTEIGTFEGFVVDGNFTHGRYVYNNGARYVGEMKDGKRYGHGHLVYEGGDEYKGYFKDGLRHGRGSYTCFSNKKRVVGMFVNGKLQGDGICYYGNGSVCYKGNYKDGRKHGFGRLFYKCSNPGTEGQLQYEGYFTDGKKCGKGILYFSNGLVLYEGEFKDNFRHGVGTLHSKSGAKIVCTFVRNVVNGVGKSFNHKGEINYEGNFENGQRNGKGIFYFRDGSSYEGEFKNGASHGKGVLRSVSHGLIFDGLWTRVKEVNNFDFEGEVIDVLSRETYFGKWVCGINEKYDEENLIFHFGKMCRQCLSTPIVGKKRYQCTIYPKKCSTVYCNKCFTKNGKCTCHSHGINEVNLVLESQRLQN